MRSRYNNETGLILTEFDIKIYKTSRKVELKLWEYKVLISNDKNYVVETSTGRFMIIDKLTQKHTSNICLNKFSVYEQKWNTRVLEDYIRASVITTMSMKNAVNKLKKKLYAYIRKESYFYGTIIEEIELKISRL